MTLKEKLSDWVDWDAAEFELAVTLGVLDGGQESWLKNKAIFWSANRADDFLHGILQAFVRAGILEYRTEPDQQYRWNQDHSLIQR
jgi:hypothetical protein